LIRFELINAFEKSRNTVIGIAAFLVGCAELARPADKIFR